MMTNILGIIGSPRKLGNCEIMVKEISRQIDAPHTLTLLRLTDFNVLACRACYRCLFDKERCVQDDDFQKIIDALVSADALIVAAPTYFLAANACLKRFLDRGLALYAYLDDLWNKPAVGVGIAGINGKEGCTLLDIESFLKLLFADIKDCRICYGALPGEVMLDDANKTAARNLASALFSTTKYPSGDSATPHCPLCGGKTFRFIGENRIRCMLCSNPGTINMSSTVPEFEVRKDAHSLFLSRQEAFEHKQWLLQMKDHYLRRKKELKKVCMSFLKDGVWIKP